MESWLGEFHLKHKKEVHIPQTMWGAKGWLIKKSKLKKTCINIVIQLRHIVLRQMPVLSLDC